jgi:ribonuclease P protein component
MLEKKYRLCKRKQFNYIYKKGRSSGCDCLTLVYCYCKMPNIKIGFSASKKVGGSVERHRALRKMRAAARPIISTMAANHNYIFIAKENILEKSVNDIQKALEHVLKKAGLVKAP